MVPWLHSGSDRLPPTQQALPAGSAAPGLLAAGGELTLERLTEAYSHGVFPWYGEGQPVMWWSPDPRMVLHVSEFKLNRSLRKTLIRFNHTPHCELRIDSAFKEVITACSTSPRDGQDGTWIVPEMVEAYCALHSAGIAHSVETWVDGQLVGGLYGVSLGRMFFGESMFSQRTDASKIALAALVCFCREHGLPLIDCQQNTRHLASLGARELHRAAFEADLQRQIAQPRVDAWTYHPALWGHLLNRT